MFIAQEKRQSNVAEYLLYMWQVENVIRTAQFDINVIEKSIIDQMGLDDNQREQEIEWYKGLIAKMKKEQLLTKGHLLELRDLVVELSYVHNSLLNNVKDSNYGFIYNTARPFIQELKAKQEGLVHDEVEICLNGLFAFWMLKAGKKEVSASTSQAMGAISKLIGTLSNKYKEMMASAGQVAQN